MKNTENLITEGQTVVAETEQGRRVRVYVTMVESDGSVWGYRVNTRQRQFAQTSHPRHYSIPA